MGNSSSCESLNKEDVLFLMKHTGYTEDAIHEWYKGFYSDCPSGKLSSSAFISSYQKFFPGGNATEFCKHIFRTFDRDGNGYIDFKEFLLAIYITSGGSAEEKLDWAFTMYDVDGNGHIDLNEMTLIVRSIFKMIGPDQAVPLAKGDTAENRAEDIFRRMDLNSDGKIEREEFVKVCSQDQNLVELLTPNLKKPE